MGTESDIIATAKPQRSRAKIVRLAFATAALGPWTAWTLWSLVRIEFIEILNPVIGWAVIASPVLIYVLVLRRTVTSAVAGLPLIGTRVWIISVLETSTSSTAALVVIPALFSDALAIGLGVIAEQLLSYRRGRP